MKREDGVPTQQSNAPGAGTELQSATRERSRASLIRLIATYTAGRLLIVAVVAAVLLAFRTGFDLQIPIAVPILAAIGLGSVGSFVALRTMRERLRDEIDYWDSERRMPQE